jgi:predicted ATP-dependent serine protease
MAKQRYRFVCSQCGASTKRITVRSKDWRLIDGYAYHKCPGQERPRLLHRAELKEGR